MTRGGTIGVGLVGCNVCGCRMLGARWERAHGVRPLAIPGGAPCEVVAVPWARRTGGGRRWGGLGGLRGGATYRRRGPEFPFLRLARRRRILLWELLLTASCFGRGGELA